MPEKREHVGIVTGTSWGVHINPRKLLIRVKSKERIMAEFRTIRAKEKRYVFDALENRQQETPAAVVFNHFPLKGQDFIPKSKDNPYKGINLKKVQDGDEEEQEKFYAVFLEQYTQNKSKIDYEAFVRECVDHFEDLKFDGAEINTPDDFIAINPEAFSIIAQDIYQYAQKKDEFSAGESTASRPDLSSSSRGERKATKGSHSPSYCQG